MGKVEFLFDPEDAHLLEGYKWQISTQGYVVRQIATGVRKRKEQRFHRLVLNAGPNQIVDHINGNKLDNRRANLRLVSKSQNGMNRPAQANNKSGFKRVSFHKSTGQWQANIKVNGRTMYLGQFACPADAATVYNFAALEYYGEYAQYNLVPQPWLEQA